MLRLVKLTCLAVSALAMLGSMGLGRTGRTERMRVQPPSIVWIPTGEFTMGTDSQGVRRAVGICTLEDPAPDPAHPRMLVTRDVFTLARCLLSIGVDPGAEVSSHPSVCHDDLFIDERGAHIVWLRGFGMDRTEVTVAAYDRCVRAGVCRAGPIALGTLQYGAPDQPIVGASWDEAERYCGFAGGRLPTEAEWERGARGTDRRPFPWGFQYDPRRANHGALNHDCTDRRDGFALTAPVGSYPAGASPEGLLDMAGNVSEWVADLWDDSLSRYPDGPDARRVDPHGATRGASRILRGGSYDLPAFALRTTYRYRAGTGARSASIGFRCAYDTQR